MDPNMNQQGFPPPESYDNYHSFGSNPVQWQDSTPRFRPQGHYQGPYPTSGPRMRPHGEFQQRGRVPYNRRGGPRRPQNRDRNFDQQQQQQQQQEPSADNNEYPTATTTTTPYSYNRNPNKFYRPSMLEDPWANMKPQKVPSNGTTLVFDSINH